MSAYAWLTRLRLAQAETALAQEFPAGTARKLWPVVARAVRRRPSHTWLAVAVPGWAGTAPHLDAIPTLLDGLEDAPVVRVFDLDTAAYTPSSIADGLDGTEVAALRQRACGSKRAYSTSKAARDAARRACNQSGEDICAYRCEFVHGPGKRARHWHIGHSVPPARLAKLRAAGQHHRRNHKRGEAA